MDVQPPPLPPLLQARNRLGLSVVEAVQLDVAAHGLGRVAQLRMEQPAAWVKMTCELATLAPRLRNEAYLDGDPRPRRRSRPGRRPERPPPPEIPQALAEALLDTVLADFEEHGATVIAGLRAHPKQYAALLKACVRFQLLARQRPVPIGPRREARPLRVSRVVEAIHSEPIDPADPMLPPRLLPRFQRMVERFGPGPWPLPWSLDGLRAAWEAVGSQRKGDGWDEHLEAWMAAHVVRAAPAEA